ncbi:MAG: hypothetical protein JWP75_410 [Frondihabitans sp.]|nr:hypothetical protein [Frondihabitans sp.]
MAEQLTARSADRDTVKPTVSARSFAPVRQVRPVLASTASESAFRRPLVTRKRVVLPLVGFAATFAFLSASLINPLSGAYASTATAVTETAPAAQGYTISGQNYTVSAGSAPSTARDAYTVQYTAPVVVKPKVAATTSTATTTTTTTTATAPVAGTPDPGSAQAVGAQLVAARGWDTSQYNCLVSLWDKESGWNVYASNASGAYGIPQALPGSKMASVGADWQTNPATQITWGLNYIQGRYGTPCAAWAHSEANNWY